MKICDTVQIRMDLTEMIILKLPFLDLIGDLLAFPISQSRIVPHFDLCHFLWILIIYLYILTLSTCV